MKERPILFSGPMIRPILAGTKTQTRRIMDPQPTVEPFGTIGHPAVAGSFAPHIFGSCLISIAPQSCPYGGPGDRLYVKETYAVRTDIDVRAEPLRAKHYAIYRADESGDPRDPMNWHDYGGRWRSPRFMPRALSRIALEVTSIRVERVQDISEGDAWAEGIGAVDGMISDAAICKAAKEAGCSFEDAKATYGALWDSINGERKVRVPVKMGHPRYGRGDGCVTEIDRSGSWEANPWVWVVKFARTPGNESARLRGEG